MALLTEHMTALNQQLMERQDEPVTPTSKGSRSTPFKVATPAGLASLFSKSKPK
jgi:hypothetical protein